MSDHEMTDWVREKLESVLAGIATVADIAKDPETAPWYRRNLREPVFRAFHDGLKVLLWNEKRLDEWDGGVIEQVTGNGTMGLVALLNRLKVPHQIRTDAPTVDPRDVEGRELVLATAPPQRLAVPWANPVRQAVIQITLMRLADRRGLLTGDELRLLAWVAHHVAIFECADTCVLSRQHMFADMGIGDAEGAEALRGLLEKRLVQEVKNMPVNRERTIALRVLVEDVNDARHE